MISFSEAYFISTDCAMKMPAFEKLRNSRDRHFQKMTASKPRSRFLAFVNAPLFLWSISAVFITLASAYYTQRQECLGKSDVLIMRYKNVLREANVRRETIRGNVRAADSFNAIDAKLTSLPSIYRDFAGTTLEELTQEQSLLEEKINFDGLQKWFEYYANSVKTFSDSSFTSFGSIYVGSASYVHRDLDRFKVFAENYLRAANLKFEAVRDLVYEPTCDSKSLFKSLLSGERKTLAKANLSDNGERYLGASLAVPGLFPPREGPANHISGPFNKVLSNPQGKPDIF